MQIVMERATGADLDAVAALEAQSFTNPWTRTVLERVLAESAVTRLYVLRTPVHHVAAFCLCWLIVDEVHINTVAVDPHLRRQGLATRLLDFVLSDAAADGAQRATLEVRQSNTAALALYRRLKFAVCATRPRYYTQPDEDALILWREGLGPAAPQEKTPRSGP
jgi:[ribosomal protein S18]-alanine N-acetyltransferase